jgi:hypothetical protein
MRIKIDLRKAWGPDRNKRDIAIIHIGLYHLDNGILDIAISFQFMYLWTRFWWLELREGYSRKLIQERGKMDLIDISSLMASQQIIKINNSHEGIDMVTKTEKLQIFWKSHKLIILEWFFKSNYTKALRSFQLLSSVL